MYYASQDGTKVDEEFAEDIIEQIHEGIDNLEDKIEKSATKKTSLGN